MIPPHDGEDSSDPGHGDDADRCGDSHAGIVEVLHADEVPERSALHPSFKRDGLGRLLAEMEEPHGKEITDREREKVEKEHWHGNSQAAV